MTFKQIQNKVIHDYRVTINEHSTCYSRTHAHVKKRMICKWCAKNSIVSTFTLFHEIGHIETTTSKMRRCESEYYATVFAINLCNKYNLTIPDKIIKEYQEYIDEEYARGIRRYGQNYPSLLELKLCKDTTTNREKQIASQKQNEMIEAFTRCGVI